jgi:hypothetical protein
VDSRLRPNVANLRLLELGNADKEDFKDKEDAKKILFILQKWSSIRVP